MINTIGEKKAQLLHTILDISPNCIYVKDQQGRYIIANKTIAKLYQTTPDEMIGKKDEDFANQAILKPNEADFFEDIDRKTIETKETQIIPCESFTYDDGTTHYFLTTKTPITYLDNPNCVLGISVDITKLKEKEIQASENEQKFKSLFNNSPDIIALTNLDGTILDINRVGEGYNKQEFIGANFKDFLSDEDTEVFQRTIDQVIQTGKPKGYYCRIRNPMGKTVHWYNRISPQIINGKPSNLIINCTDITERKDTEQKLDRIFTMSSELICEADLNTATFTKINPAFTKVLGYSEEELLSKSFIEFIHPDDKEPTQKVIDEQLQRGEKVLTFINRYRCKDGSYVWLDWNSHPVPEEGFTYAVARDITEKKNAEEELKKSEKKFKTLFNSSSDALFIHSLPDEKIVDVNEETLKRYGYTKEEMLNLTVDDLSDTTINSTKSDETQQLYQKLLNGETIQTEWCSKKKDGETFWHLMTLKVVELDGEKRLLAQAKNIDEMVRSRNKLAESEKKYRNYIENAPNGVFISDEQGRFLEVNDKAVKTTGYSKDELLQMSIADMIPEEGKEQGFQHFQTLLTEGKSVGEAPFVHKDGTMRWWQINAVKISENRFLGFTQDITEKKKIEEDLRKSEEKYRGLYEAQVNGFAIFKSIFNDQGEFISYEFIDINPAYEQITGVKREEVIGKDIQEVFPGTEQSWIDAYGSVAVSGESKTFEMYHQPTQKHYYCTVFRPGNDNKRFCVAFNDITEHKQAELQIRESEEKYRNIVELAPDGILTMDMKGFITSVNPAFLSLSGFSREEIEGKHFTKLPTIFESDIKTYAPIIKTLLLGGTSKTLNFKWKKKNGEQRLGQAKISVMKVEGKRKAVQAIVRDITEEKKAEETIRKSEEKYHALFDTMAQGVVYQNADGEIISANPAAERILGLTLSQMQGRTSMHPDWKAVDKDKNILPGDKHPAMVALRTGREVSDFLEGIFNPEMNEYVWIIVNAVPQFKGGSDTPYQVFSTFLDVTERIKMEEENRNLALFPSENPNPVIRVTSEGQILYSNQAGLTLLQSKDRGVGDFIPESKQEYIKQAFESNEYTKRTFHYMGKTYLLSLAPVQEKGYVNVYGQDITEKEQAQQQLEQSKKESEMILNTAGDGIRIVNKDFEIKNVNDTFLDMMDMPRDACIDNYCYDVFKSADCGTENCAMRKVLRTGEGFECEQSRITKSNREIPCIYRVTPYRDKQDKIIGIIEDFRDITSLKQSQARFENIFENKGTATGIFGDDSVITECNSKFVEQSGYSRDEIIGKMHWYDFVHNDDIGEMMRFHKQRSEGGKPPGLYECRMVRKNGEIRTMVVNIGMISNSKERIVSLVDITKQKNVEHELALLNENLEKEVEDRTQQIQQLLEQKDEFINQLGHDIKNPLGPLVNLLPLLEKNETDLKKKKMIQVMNRNVTYIKNLVTRTIQLAQLKSPSTGLKYEEFDLGREIHDIVVNHQLHFDEKQITVENNIPENMLVYADKLKIHEVFNNLLNNAVKYNKQQGHIIIDQMSDDDTITVSIMDTGVGMNSEQLQRVFDEFYKADMSRHDFDSSGLGMPITKRIVELHGGKIWAESNGIDKGSTFYFTLPKVTECEPQ